MGTKIIFNKNKCESLFSITVVVKGTILSQGGVVNKAGKKATGFLHSLAQRIMVITLIGDGGR